MDAIKQFPHCDSLVLHAPGDCEFCDKHPDWQQLRKMWKINFTGHYEPDHQPCPAEARRSLSTINKWGGNAPVKDAPEEQDIVYRLRKRAEIRRQITSRKSVQEGKPDRIADLLEEAANDIEKRRNGTTVESATRGRPWINSDDPELG